MHHFEWLDPLAEVHAVKAHFRSVLWLLRQRRPADLDPAQKKVRALLLGELEAYAAGGVFPKNRNFPGERRPTFIDEDGTRCAVAHLLELSGEAELALSVRDRMNFAPVSEIVEDTRFVSWLTAAGFTREEIALVQPSYCEEKRYECICPTYLLAPADSSLVTYQRKGWGYEITEVHRPAPGVAVGQRLSLYQQLVEEPEGSEYLGYVVAGDGSSDPALAPGRLYPIVDGQSKACGSGAFPPLTKAEVVKALLSPSPEACGQYLTSLDGDWDDGGCCDCDMTMQGGSSSASLAVLAAVVAAIAARRRS